MNRKVLGIYLSVLLTAGILSGCAGGAKEPSAAELPTASQSADVQTAAAQVSDADHSAVANEAAETGSTFVYARTDSVTSLDLHRQITMNNAFAIDKIFEPLVNFDQDGNIINWLADSYETSDDGLVYTFTLQDGLKFSDGTDVTADDVVFSLNRHLSLDEAGESALSIEAKVASVEAKDDRTVEITLEEPFTPFLSELASFACGVLPKDFGGKTEEEFFESPVGTGPFIVSQWDKAGDLVFTKNPYYWQEGKPYLDKLVYTVIDNDAAALQQLNAGQITGIETLNLANAAEVEDDADTKLAVSPSYTVEEIFFNTTEEHLADVHVRRAIALCLDRDAINQAMTFGYGDVANTVLPAPLKYETNQTVDALAYDVEAAKAELAQSAYPDGFSIDVIVPSGTDTRMKEAAVLKGALAQIGIDVNIQAEETATFRSDFMAFNYDIMINSATADFPDADSIFAFQVDYDGWSKCYWTSYNDPEARRLQKEGQTMADGEERAAVYADLQQILADEVPYIPLYNAQIVVGLRANVDGVTVLPNGSIRFEDVSLK